MKEYKTRNLYLVSYLMTLNIKYTKTEDEGGRKFAFYYEQTPELKEATDIFFDNKARVEPMQFAFAMKQVKSQLFYS